MKTKETKKASKAAEPTRTEQKPKSKTTLFREKYPEGIGYIANMRAVLR